VEDEPSRDVLNYVVVMPILIRIENHTMAGKTIKIQHSLIFTQKGQQVMFSTTGKFFDSWFLFRTPVFRPKTVFCSFKKVIIVK